jgi:hypothetical protein
MSNTLLVPSRDFYGFANARHSGCESPPDNRRKVQTSESGLPNSFCRGHIDSLLHSRTGRLAASIAVLQSVVGFAWEFYSHKLQEFGHHDTLPAVMLAMHLYLKTIRAGYQNYFGM